MIKTLSETKQEKETSMAAKQKEGPKTKGGKKKGGKKRGSKQNKDSQNTRGSTPR